MPKTLDQIFDSSIETFAEAYICNLNKILKGIDLKSIREFIELLLASRRENSKVFFIGNGGSASTASHFANDLAIGTRQETEPFRVISLADNVSIITALGNDVGFSSVFSDQVKAYGTAGDTLVAISASGNSPNLIEAFIQAKKQKLKTVAITSFDGGELMRICDKSIHVPTPVGEYGPAEDAHLILNHLIHAYIIRYVKQHES